MNQQAFPNLDEGRNWHLRSKATPRYNCIAWSLQNDEQVIWPDNKKVRRWPPSLPRNESVQNFVDFFQMCGFVRCANGLYEEGKEKIVIYALNGLVKHASRQTKPYVWTTKMGFGVDAEHELPGVLTGGYGQIELYMERADTGAPPSLPPMEPPAPKIYID